MQASWGNSGAMQNMGKKFTENNPLKNDQKSRSWNDDLGSRSTVTDNVTDRGVTDRR